MDLAIRKMAISNNVLAYSLLIVLNASGNVNYNVESFSVKKDPEISSTEAYQNRPSLLMSYVLMCGYDYLCNKTELSFPVFVNASFRHMLLCPPCYCDYACLYRGDCCPDLYFKFPPQVCRDISILNFPDDEFLHIPSRYFMTDVCPPGTTPDLLNNCTKNLTLTEKLLSPPVSSVASYPLIFLNKYCAECNGVSAYGTWELQSACASFADFNFLSSYEEVIDLATDRSCVLTFRARSLPFFNCYEKGQDNDFVYGSCNLTGTWETYDKDIDVACAGSYHYKYGIFKNVFCFMCNPQKSVNIKMISECNVTGMWPAYDRGLELACLNLPNSISTRPFKNIFCFLCNTIPVYKAYLDASVTVNTFENIPESKFTYEFTVNNLDLKTLRFEIFKNLQNVHDIDRVVVNANYMFSPEMKQKNINRIDLMSRVSSFNERGFCDPDLKKEADESLFQQNCSCDPMCDGSCCNDFALTYPLQCISNDVNMDETNIKDGTIAVVNDCFRSEYLNALHDLCIIPRSDVVNIFQFIPVDVYGTSYKNVFCLFCNDEMLKSLLNITEMELSPVDPWGIRIECDSYIDFKHHLFLFNVTEVAKSMSCEVKFMPRMFGSQFCKDERTDIETCNKTGDWANLNTNIKWACEETASYQLPTVQTYDSGTTYKNEYCIICNSAPSARWINSCNVTGLWEKYDVSLELKCVMNVVSYVHYPYKNAFCRQCNENSTSVDVLSTTPITTTTSNPINPTIFTLPPGVTTKVPRTTTPRGTSILRILFAFSQYDKVLYKLPPKTCSGSQFLDKSKDMCRNLTCYPGKFLRKGECVPLLLYTKHLRYTLAFRIHGNFSLGISRLSVLHGMSAGVVDQLKTCINLRRADFDVEELVLYTNKACDTVSSKTEPKLQTYLYLQIFIKAMVHRFDTEKVLLNFSSSQFEILMGSEQVSLELEPMIGNPINTLDLEIDYETECLLKSNPDLGSVQWQGMYRSSHVQNMLICQQVEFHSDEFKLDSYGLTLTLVPYNVQLQYNDFRVFMGDRARVCLDRIEGYMAGLFTVAANPNDTLILLTQVCFIVSLGCVSLTFFTYCLFPQLRNLPGKSNMLLMFSMFCAHLSSLLLGEVNIYTTECSVLGILTHYFWLCFFSNLSVCCLYIYRVFSGGFKNVDSSHDVNRIVFKMAIFSYGMPVLFVAANIVVTFAVTSGGSTGYGGDRCFLTHRTSFIVTLFSPLALMGIFDLFCFISTAYFILNRPNIRKNKSYKYEFLVYFRLFAVSGSAWVLQVIDSFLPISSLSYIVAVLNCLQGFFLFLSYICKKRVIIMYKDMCKRSLGSLEKSSTYRMEMTVESNGMQQARS